MATTRSRTKADVVANVAEATQQPVVAPTPIRGKRNAAPAPVEQAIPATKTTKAKAAPAEPKVLSDSEIAELTKAKENETDPGKRGKLRRQLRAALKARGEYIPLAERPKREKAAKAAKPQAEPVAPPAPTKGKKRA